MSSSRDRAEKRRAEWEGEVIRAGAPKPRLYDDLTPTERIRAFARLNRRAWLAAGGEALPALPRAEWPGEIFELRRG